MVEGGDAVAGVGRGTEGHRLLAVLVGHGVDLDGDGIQGLTEVEVGEADRGQARVVRVLKKGQKVV